MAANGDFKIAPNGTGRVKVTNATSSSTQITFEPILMEKVLSSPWFSDINIEGE